MKYYDYKKAKETILLNYARLESACLGLHEDWWWTGNLIFEDGKLTHPLPENFIERVKEFDRLRKEGKLPMFLEGVEKKPGLPEWNPEYKKFTDDFIGGIPGSTWATPVLQLRFKDGTEEFLNCYIDTGEEMFFGDKVLKKVQVDSFLGPLSKPVQENIKPIKNEEDKSTFN